MTPELPGELNHHRDRQNSQSPARRVIRKGEQPESSNNNATIAMPSSGKKLSGRSTRSQITRGKSRSNKVQKGESVAETTSHSGVCDLSNDTENDVHSQGVDLIADKDESQVEASVDGIALSVQAHEDNFESDQEELDYEDDQ